MGALGKARFRRRLQLRVMYVSLARQAHWLSGQIVATSEIRSAKRVDVATTTDGTGAPGRCQGRTASCVQKGVASSGGGTAGMSRRMRVEWT